MEQLYWRLGELGVSQVILEAREKSQRQKDLQLVNALRSKGTMPPDLRVEIGFPKDEPMLWIPDQMLGALGVAGQEVVDGGADSYPVVIFRLTLPLG